MYVLKTAIKKSVKLMGNVKLDTFFTKAHVTDEVLQFRAFL